MINTLRNIKREDLFQATYLLCIFLSVSLFVGCFSTGSVKVDYVDHYSIAANKSTLKTVFGGISGMDYDQDKHLLYLVSDDRSKYDPARIYVMNLNLGPNTIDSITPERVITLFDEKGQPYSSEGCDMESIRYMPKHAQWIIGDEGGKKGKPGIRFFDSKGHLVQSYPLKVDYLNNIRYNKAFEGLTRSLNGESLFYTTEEPLLSDGNRSTLKHKGLLRIIEAEIKSQKKKQEWHYLLEKVSEKALAIPPWGGSGSDNGLSELLLLGKNGLLTLERSGAYQGGGSFKYHCKLFYVYLNRKKKKGEEKVGIVKKKLLIDFSKIPFGDANVEGMTFGPEIDGQPTLLFVSDNNFKKNIPTQFYLFKIKNQ